jgi:hypothetical protein
MWAINVTLYVSQLHMKLNRDFDLRSDQTLDAAHVEGNRFTELSTEDYDPCMN